MSSKSTVISALKGACGFVSGEELAKAAGVSRVAIWKAVRSLQEEGHRIEASPKKGYRLLSSPDALDADQILLPLEGPLKGRVRVFTFDEIDSTNYEAKRRAVEAGAFRDGGGNLTEKGMQVHLSLFAAESQTGGKGRLGRSFLSPKGTGAYFSLIYSPRGGIKNPALYTAAASVAVARAISKLYGEEVSIKWVNDVFLGGKKICGILVEGISNFETGIIDAAVVGIGINVRQNPCLTGEISKIAGSIEEAKLAKNESFAPSSKNLLIGEVVNNLISMYDSFGDSGGGGSPDFIEEYRKRSMLTGLTVTVNPVAGTDCSSYRAKVLDVDEEMRLVVETEDGEAKKLSGGEVSLHSYDFL